MRSYGRFTTSIWGDPDFTSLTLEQQGVYFTLGLQPDVSAAGLLPYTSRRWSRLSSGTTREQIEKLIADLAGHVGEHLVVDDDTEELLIRKFIKWDMGWANSKRLPVVVDAVKAISSDRLRVSAAGELHKIATSDAVSPHVRDAVSHAISTFDRDVVKQLGYEPQPLNRNPEPSTATPESEPVGANADPPPMFCDEHPKGTDAPCAACARRRTALEQWNRARIDAEAEARRAAAETRKACTLCNDQGVREDPATGKPLGRCDHRITRALDGASDATD